MAATQRHQAGRGGQSTVEYAVLLAIVVSAFVVMQFYMKQAAMGRARSVTDQQFGRQWDPYSVSGGTTVTTSTHEKQESSTDGSSKTTLTAAETTNRNAQAETVGEITNKNLW